MFWKKLHGVNLWKLNRVFTKMAYSKISLKEQIKGDVIKIQFKTKHSNQLIGPEMKKELEENIKNLEGFINLKLCLLEECLPEYKEKLVFNRVSRWIEIHIVRDEHVKYVS